MLIGKRDLKILFDGEPLSLVTALENEFSYGLSCLVAALARAIHLTAMDICLRAVV